MTRKCQGAPRGAPSCEEDRAMKTNWVWILTFVGPALILLMVYCLVVAMPVTVALSLTSAVLLNREQTKFKNFFKVSFFLPFVTNTVAIAVVWSWLLNPSYGLLNLSLIHI